MCMNIYCIYVGFQALIQYQTRQCAVSARTALQVNTLFSVGLVSLNFILSLRGFHPCLFALRTEHLCYSCRDVIYMMVAVS